jgi:hypothetical protein
MRSRLLPICLLAFMSLLHIALAADTGPKPMKIIPDLKPNNETWDSYMGCLQGCLKYLHSDVSPAWLYGVSGHAFGLNIHKQLCPSGPHVWSGWGSLQGNEARLGLKIERVGPWYKGHDDQYQAHKQLAWDRTRKAIDAGTPCIGYDLSWGEFYVVNGYDDIGYRYWDTNMGALKQAGPVAWDKYGEGGVVHMIALQYVTAAEPTGTPREAVRAALQWAVDFGARGDANDPARQPAYASGLAAYDQWLAALDDPECWKGDGVGAMYNAEVWRECRHYAVAFLQEAKGRLGDAKLDPLFDEAIRHYERVERKLGIVCDQFSFDNPAAKAPQAERREHAQRALREAKRSEKSGLQSLSRIIANL